MSAPISDGTLERIAARAEWALAMGAACKYQMGGGVASANGPTPWNKSLLCDCSAFTDWCAGVDKFGRKSPKWQGTDQLVADGLNALKADLWYRLPAPIRGCLIVYGGRVGKDGKRHAGHVGVVISANDTIDCSSTHDGIGAGVHSVQFFLDHGAICIAPNGVA